ncbi:ABC transporter substrate-binding protein [Yoonia sp. 2307UL14-13]|uniref:ABC transporter substrate-binding protein n=1 Tax=Yoonia sp. 2307UL14-13 TaxID=3126506 RepID=UPI0030AE90DE
MTGRITLSIIFATLATPLFALECDEGMRAFAHAAGETCIPVDPQRIVTLQDQNGLLPLMELGVTPIGSSGHVNSAGEQIFRRMEGYDTSDVRWIGPYGSPPDVETIAAMQPDLIIASPWPPEAPDLLEGVAPVVVIDMFNQPLEDALFQFADVVNRTDRAEELQAQMQARAVEVRAELGDLMDTTTLSAITREYEGDGFYGIEPTQAFGAIRRALDPTMTPAEADWSTERANKSLEVIGDHAADVMMFLTFDADEGGTSSEFNSFMSEPIVQALPVAQAGQIYVLDGSQMVGSAWGKIVNGMEQISAVLLDDGINRDLVIE